MNLTASLKRSPDTNLLFVRNLLLGLITESLRCRNEIAEGA